MKITWRREKGRDWNTGYLARWRAFLREVAAYYKGMLTYMHKNKGQGLLRAKISCLLMKLFAWNMTTHHNLHS